MVKKKAGKPYKFERDKKKLKPISGIRKERIGLSLVPKNETLRLRMKYFTESELKDVRPTLLRGFEAIGVKDLVSFVKEQFSLAENLSDKEIKALFSKDIKIDRIRYARLIGNVEALVAAFVIEVARDTTKERARESRNKRALKKEKLRRVQAAMDISADE